MALQHIELMSIIYMQLVQQPKKHQKEPRKVPKEQRQIVSQELLYRSVQLAKWTIYTAKSMYSIVV